MSTGLIVILSIVGVLVVGAGIFVSSYVIAGPSEAIMISGLGKRKIYRCQSGFRIPFLQRYDKVSLETFQVEIQSADAIPTKEFINVTVDAVANLKISSEPEILERAFETILSMRKEELSNQIQKILQGGIREILGTVEIKELVQDRQRISASIRENIIPDMKTLGIELLTFNIQNFSDSDNVIQNLGIDNVVQISKDAAIAKAVAEKEIAIEEAINLEASSRAKIDAKKKILEQNNLLSLKESELKVIEDTAKADADAAYDLQSQKRKEEVNVATMNASIAQKEREVVLGEREVQLKERILNAEINKKADADKYAAQQNADAELYKRQKEAEALKYKEECEAEIKKIRAEAEKVEKEKESEAIKIQAAAEAAAKVSRAEAEKIAALAEAEAIEAKGKAEAEAIREKAEAMKLYGEAATLQLVLESGVIPKTIEAYSKPMAEAMGKINGITMYGEGNQARLVEDIGKNGDQIVKGLESTFGVDIKSLLAGFLGGKIATK